MATDGGDQDQWYTALCEKTSYTLPIRYQDLVHVGNGAFGAVM
jgi:hypothetical protein